MEQFIGTKIVQAEPMTRGEHWGSDAVDAIMRNAGGAMEKAVLDTFDDAGYRVVYEDGYQSWSPKDVFENAYRRTDGLSFGLAIEAAKMGKRIARKGWNGKGMYVFLIDVADLHTDADLSGLEGKNVTVRECFAMKCADDSICPGWLASQTDMLADDWCIVQ